MDQKNGSLPPVESARIPFWTLMGFLALYIWNAAPGITWEDSATYHKLLDAGGPLWGDAVSHRLYCLLAGIAHKLPLPGETAWRLNILNAFLSAGCLGLVYRIVLLLTGRSTAALLSMSCLGVSHLFWHYAEVAKPYPLMNLLWLASLWGLVHGAQTTSTGTFAFSGLCQGLSLGVHPYAAAFLPAAAIFLALAPRPKLRFGAGWILGWGIGAAGVLFIYTDLIHIKGWNGFVWHWAFGGQGELVTGMSQGHELLSIRWERFGRNFLEWLAYLVYQFPLSLPLAALGIPACLKRAPATGWALLIFYGSCVAIPFDFNVPLKINFYLPSFLVVAIWIGCGLELFLTLWRNSPREILVRIRRAYFVAAVAVPPVLYAVYALEPAEDFLPTSLRKSSDASYKDRARFYLWPPKRGFDEPRRYAKRAFASIEPNAVVIADFQERDILKHYQHEMGRRDLTIHHLSAWGGEENKPIREMFLTWAAEAAGDRPLYAGHVYRPLWEGSGWRGTPVGDFDRIDR